MAPHSLKDLITRVNRGRRENPALQRDDTLRFHETDNPMLLAYSKSSRDLSNVVLVVVSLDPHHAQAGWLELDCGALGIPWDQPLEVEDLVGGERYFWQGHRHPLELAPPYPAHIFVLRGRPRTEHDFDYFA